MEPVLIIGAGVSGLVAGYELTKRGENGDENNWK